MLLLAAHKGWRQKDLSEWSKLVEQWAGIEISSTDK
jgi:hypothetical protein